MAILNLMEEIVLSSIKEVIQNDKELSESNINIDDICAYVLNRIPSKYSTGERGILHGTIETKYVYQQRVDILFLIYEAINIVENRRSAGNNIDSGLIIDKSIMLPHIIGEILEESTYTPIPDVKVTLLYNNKPVDMLDDNWINPYITNSATKGYFHFWPYMVENELNGDKISFELNLSHKDMEPKNLNIEVDINKTDSRLKSFHIPITIMSVKDGVQPDFMK